MSITGCDLFSTFFSDMVMVHKPQIKKCNETTYYYYGRSTVYIRTRKIKCTTPFTYTYAKIRYINRFVSSGSLFFVV